MRDLRLRFGGVKAVDGLTFDAYAGEIISVIGPNGAGKTSAFNCITRRASGLPTAIDRGRRAAGRAAPRAGSPAAT
ncbi:ATP-binding cassette domain-containing protein [Georgenia sp. SUBG003]|uniref:ATP-binding cassette domain-containing protein n=1 Tax=Georgenia sp. SUBG003 TaxID=1497974 RepID=UPI003AB5ADE3